MIGGPGGNPYDRFPCKQPAHAAITKPSFQTCSGIHPTPSYRRRPVPRGRARQPPQPSSPTNTPLPHHRRAGEGRYPGDGRGYHSTVIPNPHRTPTTTVFPDVIRNPTVFPAKAGTQGSGVTRIPGPDRFRHNLPTPMINGPAHADGPIFTIGARPRPYLTPKPAATCEGSLPHAAASASSRTPCTKLRRRTRPRVSRSRSRGVRETDRAPLQESRCRS